MKNTYEPMSENPTITDYKGSKYYKDGKRTVGPCHFRTADGHTYWIHLNEKDVWLGAPTFANGLPDLNNAGFVSDWEANGEDVADVLEFLSNLEQF